MNSNSMATSQMLTTPSFDADDVSLLLCKTEADPVSVEEKEALVSRGGHYSDVFVTEKPMSAALKKAFDFALHQNNGSRRLAYHVQYLSEQIVNSREPGVPVVLISLVRAGVPLGVLLKRHLTKHYAGLDVEHYGVSIIRGRGIDQQALNTIHENHPKAIYFFVDGWTGKGSISMELRHALDMQDLPFEYRLVVSSDPAQTATLSATHEDWLIPFGLVGAQISGLFSRTLWADTGYHQAAYFSDLESDDIAKTFIDAVEAHGLQIPPSEFPADGKLKDSMRNTISRLTAKTASEVIDDIVTSFNLSSVHKVKPGIAEATRAVHRRTPRAIIIHSLDDKDLWYLIETAENKGVDIIIESTGALGPFKAITILK